MHEPMRRCDGSGCLMDFDAWAKRAGWIVIDPESREQVERLYKSYAKHARVFDNGYVTEMQAALREFANPTPPKPDEPTGLGAVVEADGVLFVRDKTTTTVAHWKRAEGMENGKRHRYDDLRDPVRVLSEGAQP